MDAFVRPCRVSLVIGPIEDEERGHHGFSPQDMSKLEALQQDVRKYVSVAGRMAGASASL